MRVKRKVGSRFGLPGLTIGACAFLIAQPLATAQEVQLDVMLRTLITRFQQCGSSPSDAMLGVGLYQTIFVQTNGIGCYSLVIGLGPVLRLDETSRSQLPAGPVASFTATHSAAKSYWQIGYSRYTGKVELLMTSVSGPFPPIPGDQPPQTLASPPPARPSGPAEKPTAVDRDQACLVYPDMCRQK